MADRLKVLVVDDDPGVVLLLSKLLRLHDVEVATAADGVAGVALAEVVRPDVVLLDIMMPRMDGYEVCRALKDHYDPPKIVMVTARTEPEDELAALSAGADDYVHKPFHPEDILRAVGVIGTPEHDTGADELG